MQKQSSGIFLGNVQAKVCIQMLVEKGKTIEIVINSAHVMSMCVTMSCRYCIAFKVMLLFSTYYYIIFFKSSGQ